MFYPTFIIQLTTLTISSLMVLHSWVQTMKLVTSETEMTDQYIYYTYHNLWRIEESFKIMKSDLDAHPVFLQKEQTIKGHFLICYLTVLLERILQFKILRDMYSTSDIFKFVKDFKATKAESKLILWLLFFTKFSV